MWNRPSSYRSASGDQPLRDSRAGLMRRAPEASSAFPRFDRRISKFLANSMPEAVISIKTQIQIDLRIAERALESVKTVGLPMNP